MTHHYTDFCVGFPYSNAAACTLAFDKRSKKILFAIEDERILRRKYNLYEANTRKFLQDKLDRLGIDSNDVEIMDTCGLTNEEMHQVAERHPELYGAAMGHYVALNWGKHHLYHAMNGYCQSGFNDATILVLDGCDFPGGVSIAIYTAQDGLLALDREYDSSCSLGLLYGFGSYLCGFSWNEGGKLMGLSSYGEVDYDSFVPWFTVDWRTGEIEKQNGRFIQRAYIDEAPSAIVELSPEMERCFQAHAWPDEYRPDGPHQFSFKKANLAALIQLLYETSVDSLLLYCKEQLPSRNLIITGGCGLNCVANGNIWRSEDWDNFYVPNMTDDAGNAIGAAIVRYGVTVNGPMVYNKITYPVPQGWSKVLSPDDVAQMLWDGRIIAWFEGGSEYGPRALCHRSLLAEPSNPGVHYRLNEIKHREYWRPLAPVVLDTEFSKIFAQSRFTEMHRNMLATEYLQEWAQTMYRPICAADGTSRPQVLTDNPDNHTLYTLMKEHELNILVNTSMNDRGEPICETPEEAIAFCNKNPDVLLVFVKDGVIYGPDA